MFFKIKKLFSRKFLVAPSGVYRGMLIILMGAGLARIVGIVSIPALARIYTPEDYGVLALYTSLVTMLAPIMTLRYVQAIPLPKTDLIAFNLFSVCFKLIVFFSLLLAFALAVWGEVILGWFNMEVLMPWRWLIVLGATGTALYELFSLWATRKRKYTIISKAQLTQSLTGNAAKILLGLLGYKPSGMIIGQFLSQSSGITSFVKDARDELKAFVPKIRRNKEILAAKYYQNFVWFRFPSQILMVLSVQAPVLMMASLYGKELTGQLSMAMMALSLPVGLIGEAMSKAYYAEISSLGKNNINKIIKLTFSVQKNLFYIGIPLAIIIYYSSEFVFKLILGDSWATAGIFSSLLAPFILFQFTSSPLMEVINILSAQIVYLILHILRVIGLAMIFIYSSQFGLDSTTFVILISGYLSLFYLFASILVLSLLVRFSR